MNFTRILVVTGVLAATASVVPDEVAAQSLTIDETIAVQSNWMSGYMGLGGGLAKAMPRHAEKKTVSAAPARRIVRRSAPQPVRHINNGKPTITLIAETLDHTGENIATLGAHAERR